MRSLLRRLRAPVPFCCPPVHKNEPDSASVPAPVSVPLVWVMGPWPVTVAPAGIGVIVPKASSTGPVSKGSDAVGERREVAAGERTSAPGPPAAELPVVLPS